MIASISLWKVWSDYRQLSLFHYSHSRVFLCDIRHKWWLWSTDRLTWLPIVSITGVDEVCLRRATRCESRHEVAVHERAQRSSGAVFHSALASTSLCRRFSTPDAQRAKQTGTTGVECPVRLYTLRRQQHRQMCTESRRRPPTIQGHSIFFCDSAVSVTSWGAIIS